METLIVRDKTFYKMFIGLALPVILQSAVNMGVNIMSTLMLGSYGEVQLSASSLANDLISVFTYITLGVGGGAAVLTAQYWGRGDVTSLKKIVAIMLRIIICVAFVFMAAAAFFPKQIMSIYTDDKVVINDGALFLRVSIPNFLLVGINLSLTAVLRSVRQVRLPLLTSCCAFVVYIFFGWVFIFGNLGAPEMKVAGSALALVIARFVETGVMVFYILKIDKKIRFRVKDIFVPVKEYVSTFIKYCLPVVGSDLFFGLGSTAIAIIIGHTSTGYVAANAILSTVVRLTLIVTNSVGNAGSVITGNTLGKGDVKRAYSGAVTFLMLSTMLGIISSLLVLIIAPIVVAGCNITEETAAIAKSLTYAVGLMTVFVAMDNSLTKGILRGGGDTRFLLVMDTVFLWGISIPLGALTALVWKAPPFWIYLSLRSDWVIKVVLCTIRLISRKWIHVLESPKNAQLENSAT